MLSRTDALEWWEKSHDTGSIGTSKGGKNDVGFSLRYHVFFEGKARGGDKWFVLSTKNPDNQADPRGLSCGRLSYPTSQHEGLSAAVVFK